MKTANVKFKSVNNYFTLLKHLSKREKLELIAQLSKSIDLADSERDSDWDHLFGALQLDQPAAEFLVELKKDRNFRQKSFDL